MRTVDITIGAEEKKGEREKKGDKDIFIVRSDPLSACRAGGNRTGKRDRFDYEPTQVEIKPVPFSFSL